jgi:hypothetical protein
MHRSILAAACGWLALLGAATPALAESGIAPKKATNYAAGDMTGSFTDGDDMLASVGVRSGGKRVDVLFRVAGGVDTSCSYATTGGTTTSIRRDGTFSAKVKLQPDGDAAAAGSVTVKGEFVSDDDYGVLVGMTARAKVPISGGKTCDSGNVDLVAVDPSKGLSGKPAKKAFYVGLLDAKSTIVPVKLPIMVRLTSNGKALDTAATTVGAKCQSGKTVTPGLLAVTKDALSGSRLDAQDTSLVSNATDRAIVITKLDVTFGSRAVTGTFQLSETFQDAAGTTTKDVCDSGAVKTTLTRIG